jgi:hypothetical protein
MTAEKITKEKKSTAKLISYAIKAVIPTGPYANIQPEIHVSAGTIEEAAAFVIPHLDELFEKYLNISERPKARVTVTPTVPPAPKPVEVPKEKLEGLVEALGVTPEDFNLATAPKASGTPGVTPEEFNTVSGPKASGTPGVTILPGGKLPPTIEELQAQAVAPVAPVTPASPYPPIDSPAGKAKLAVESCKSIEALNLINIRIQESVKLDALDKADLTVIVNSKRVELTK